MWVRRQAGESLLCGKDNRDTGEEGGKKKSNQRQPKPVKGQQGPLSPADKNLK